MDMRTDAYVASTSANIVYALEPENVIAVTYYGPDPLGDAKSYAKDHVKSEEVPAYVYRVTLEPVHKYEILKEVVGSAHTL